MIKKSFFFFFIFSLFHLFSNELSLFITDNKKNPINGAFVTMNNEIKKSDINGFVQFTSTNNFANITVEKSPYKSEEFVSKLTEDINIEVTLQESFDFYFNIFEGNNFEYNFLDVSSNTVRIKEAIINIYKNNELIKSLDYYGKDLGVDLKDGEYTLVIFTLFSSPYVIENMKFNTQKNNYLNINIPVKLLKLNGTITSSNSLLGGALIKFKDKNREIETFSNIEGTYSINIPSGFYEMTISKFGYETLVSNIKIDDNKIDLSYNMNELPSIIKGRIIDNNGIGIPNQSISIKNNNQNLLIITDSKGFFETNVYTGLAFLKINIPGFFPTGRVEKIDTLSTKIVPDIKLTERTASLSGTVSNGILPLSNISIKLYDIKGTYFGMVKTDSKGFFSFEKIKSGIEYYLKIDDSNYSNYQSNSFINEDNQNKNFTIILNNNDINFILELKSKTPIDYSGISVYINNNKFQIDKNGIINEVIQSTKEIKNLVIEIPKLGIKKTFELSELGSEPYLITINF